MIRLDEIRRIAEWLAEVCDDDERLFADYIEGETDVYAMLSQVYDRIASDEELLAGIKERQDALAERKKRLEHRRDMNREAIGKILRAAGIKKAELVECTVSVRDGKAKLVVNDPDAVPAEYTRTKVEVDKSLVNAAFADAEELPNWLMRSEPRDTVTIRGR